MHDIHYIVRHLKCYRNTVKQMLWKHRERVINHSWGIQESFMEAAFEVCLKDEKQLVRPVSNQGLSSQGRLLNEQNMFPCRALLSFVQDWHCSLIKIHTELRACGDDLWTFQFSENKGRHSIWSTAAGVVQDCAFRVTSWQ